MNHYTAIYKGRIIDIIFEDGSPDRNEEACAYLNEWIRTDEIIFRNQKNENRDGIWGTVSMNDPHLEVLGRSPETGNLRLELNNLSWAVIAKGDDSLFLLGKILSSDTLAGIGVTRSWTVWKGTPKESMIVELPV